MANVKKKIEQYIADVLGISAVLSVWHKQSSLPVIIRNSYDVYQMELFGGDYLLIADKSNEVKTPSTIAKHITLIQKKHDIPIIYSREAITSNCRYRLIEQKIPFIIPGNQLYLPPAGVDLREYYKQPVKQVEVLTPAAQAIFIYFLLHSNAGDVLTVTDLIDSCGYTRMSINRACKELLQSDLLKYEGTPKRGGYSLVTGSREDILKKALPLLRTPVKAQHYVKGDVKSYATAGFTALSNHTMIAPPTNKCIAMTTKQFKALKVDVAIFPYADENSTLVEVWSYDPIILADSNSVDKVSLYLSLKDSDDERVQIELEEMMKENKWL